MPHVYLLCVLLPSAFTLRDFEMTAFLVSTTPVHLVQSLFIHRSAWVTRYTHLYVCKAHTHTFTLWGILGIRERLYCRQHINKMFHFPLSAVCMKTAPVLHRSCSTLSLHHRLPHFSLLLLTFSFAWCYKDKENKAGLHQRSIKDERREEKRRKQESVFSFLVFFLYSLCFVNSGSPESRAAGVSFRVDTGTLGTLSLLRGKTCEKLFY